MKPAPPPPITHRPAQLETHAPLAPGRELVATAKLTGIPSFTVRAEGELYRITVTRISATPLDQLGHYQAAKPWRL